MRLQFCLLALLALFAVQAPAKEKDASPDPGLKKAPGFTMAAFPGGKARLKDYQGKWLALCFYPKANAPKDVLQMVSLREAFPEIQKMNGAVLGVSMDPPAVVEKFQKDQALPFPLACDTTKEVSTAYGALGLGGLFSSRRTILINPEGQIAGVIDKCPEKNYGSRVVEKLKSLQAAGKSGDQ